MSLKTKILKKFSGIKSKIVLATVSLYLMTIPVAAVDNVTNVTGTDVLNKIYQFFYDYLYWILLAILVIVVIYYIMRLLRN